MRTHGKRWLMSMMKTSGSRRTHVRQGDYAHERHLQKGKNPDSLPHREGIKSSSKFYNGKINYGLLVRFLRGQVGNDWDEIYSEIISRIPTKLLPYKDSIFWFVADKVQIVEGRIWNTKSQQFLWTACEKIESVHYTQVKSQPERKEFYVDPVSNKLVRIEQKSFKRLMK